MYVLLCSTSTSFEHVLLDASWSAQRLNVASQFHLYHHSKCCYKFVVALYANPQPIEPLLAHCNCKSHLDREHQYPKQDQRDADGHVPAPQIIANQVITHGTRKRWPRANQFMPSYITANASGQGSLLTSAARRTPNGCLQATAIAAAPRPSLLYLHSSSLSSSFSLSMTVYIFSSKAATPYHKYISYYAHTTQTPTDTLIIE